MWWNRDTWWHDADWHRWSHHADGQRDTWSDHADGDWSASSQPDTRWHHANWHCRVWCPEVFEEAAGLVTDLLAQGLDAARLGRFLHSTCARDVVWSLVGEDAWDGFPNPLAAVEDAADNVSGSPSPTPAAYEDGTGELHPAPSQTVAAACALTASPAGTSPGGDESGGLGPFEPASMATSSRAVDPPTALGPTYREAGQAFQPYVRRCQGCQIFFSSRSKFQNYCCSVCRRTGGKAHSSGKPTCKREMLDVGRKRVMEDAESLVKGCES